MLTTCSNTVTALATPWASPRAEALSRVAAAHAVRAATPTCPVLPCWFTCQLYEFPWPMSPAHRGANSARRRRIRGSASGWEPTKHDERIKRRGTGETIAERRHGGGAYTGSWFPGSLLLAATAHAARIEASSQMQPAGRGSSRPQHAAPAVGRRQALSWPQRGSGSRSASPSSR
jgi:hypothetical protein